MDCQVVIHAGGKGTRLRPYTIEKPKPLLQVGDRTLIELAIQPFLNAGIKKFILTASYKAEKIRQFFKEKHPDLNVSFIDEPEPAGRAGAVRLGIEQSKLDPERLTIITHADDLIKINIPKTLEEFKRNDSEAAIVLSKKFTNPFGVVCYSNNKITQFEEKAKTEMPEGQAVNTGMKLFRNLKYFLKAQIPSHEEYTILPKLAKQGELAVFFAQSWTPINTKDEYHKLIKEME